MKEANWFQESSRRYNTKQNPEYEKAANSCAARSQILTGSKNICKRASAQKIREQLYRLQERKSNSTCILRTEVHKVTEHQDVKYESSNQHGFRKQQHTEYLRVATLITRSDIYLAVSCFSNHPLIEYQIAAKQNLRQHIENLREKMQCQKASTQNARKHNDRGKWHI